MKLSYWFYAFGFLGLVAPIVLLLLQRGGIGVSAFVVASVWPMFILAAVGVLGMHGWWAWGITILLNGVCYGVLGYLTGLLWQKAWKLKFRGSDRAT